MVATTCVKPWVYVREPVETFDDDVDVDRPVGRSMKLFTMRH